MQSLVASIIFCQTLKLGALTLEGSSLARLRFWTIFSIMSLSFFETLYISISFAIPSTIGRATAILRALNCGL